MWRLDRPGAKPEFFLSPIAAIAAVPDLNALHVVWFDSFDYDRYNRGRAA